MLPPAQRSLGSIVLQHHCIDLLDCLRELVSYVDQPLCGY